MSVKCYVTLATAAIPGAGYTRPARIRGLRSIILNQFGVRDYEAAEVGGILHHRLNNPPYTQVLIFTFLI